MQRVRGRWLSMRWTVLEAGREAVGFIEGARARTAAEFEDAMARSYRAPAQNMLAADRGGHIAIRSTGRYPIRGEERLGAAGRHVERERLAGRSPRRAMAAGVRSRAGVSRVSQSAASRSARIRRLVRRRLRPVARAAHQRAPARRQRGHRGRHAPLPDRSGQRARRLLRALLPRGRAPRGAAQHGPEPPRARGGRALPQPVGPQVHRVEHGRRAVRGGNARGGAADVG